MLLAACASNSVTPDAWTHATLSDAQRQQQSDQCMQQAVAAEKAYFDANARGSANATVPFINNLKVRQRAMGERTSTFESCMQSAGFTRSN